MSKILVIEDELDMSLGLKDNFEFEGYEVLTAADGETGLNMAVETHPDLIILDIMLPKKSGFEVCKELRAQNIKTPVIMLTARGQEIDKVLGLELGADDYITKPFSVRELLARVKAVLRRSTADKKGVHEMVYIGKLRVDFDRYQAFAGSSEVDLSAREFELLKYLHQNANKVVSREELLNHVWGYEMYPTTRTVDNFVAKLRKKLEENSENPKHILTVYGIGYKFVE